MLFLLWLILWEEPVPAPQLFETAVVRARALDSATTAITVIDRATIEASGARNAAEVLLLAPGLTLTRAGAGSSFTTASLRGGDSNFTAVLVDGVPVNNLAYQVGGAYDLAGLSLASIERVEIVRFSLSSTYGSTGLAGAINFITRRGSGSTYEAEGGSDDRRRLQVNLHAETGPFSHQLGAGYDELNADSAESLRAHYANLRSQVELPGANLEFHGHYSGREGSDYPDASGGPNYHEGSLRTSDHRELVLGSRLSFGGADHQRQQLRLSAFQHQLDRSSPAIYPVVPASQEELDYSELRLGWRMQALERERLSLHLGLEWTRQRADNQSVLDLGFPLSGSYLAERDLMGFTTDMLLKNHGLWELSSRLDKSEGRGFQWSPRLGYRRDLSPSLDVRASAGRAYKLPDFFATASPAALGGNPELRPEVAKAYDLGLTLKGPGLSANLTAFVSRYENLIDFDFAQFLHVNRSEVRSHGVEAALDWQASERLSTHVNLTWQEADIRDEPAALRHRPHWIGAASVSWRPRVGPSLYLDGRMRSAMEDVQIPVPERHRVGGYAYFGLTASQAMGKHWQARLRFDNLGDDRYEELIGFPGDRRAWRLALSYKER